MKKEFFEILLLWGWNGGWKFEFIINVETQDDASRNLLKHLRFSKILLVNTLIYFVLNLIESRIKQFIKNIKKKKWLKILNG